VKSYDELRDMIQTSDDGREMKIVCRETKDSWIDTSYVVTASEVDGRWWVDSPDSTERVDTQEQAIESMIDMADLFFTAEDTRRQDEEHQP